MMRLTVCSGGRKMAVWSLRSFWTSHGIAVVRNIGPSPVSLPDLESAVTGGAVQVTDPVLPGLVVLCLITLLVRVRRGHVLAGLPGLLALGSRHQVAVVGRERVSVEAYLGAWLDLVIEVRDALGHHVGQDDRH